MIDRAGEAAEKIDLVRRSIGGREAICFRGIDWFAWITAGGSSAVLLAAETGIAEVLVTRQEAVVLTDAIEVERLKREEVPEIFSFHVSAWIHPGEREQFVRRSVGTATVLSDRPRPGELPLPAAIAEIRQMLRPPEIHRYREVGRLAAEAMTEALTAATPEWTEGELAGAGAGALLRRGVQPGLVLAAGERRLSRYRHPVPTGERLGSTAMLVFCGRRHGLWANMTRFVSFGPLQEGAAEGHRLVRQVEAAVLRRASPGTKLGDLYRTLAEAYGAAGYPEAITEHHQGGTTGYLPREALLVPGSNRPLGIGTAIALNPSLPGAKIEDTFIINRDGLENLTMSPDWPTERVENIPRPLVLQR